MVVKQHQLPTLTALRGLAAWWVVVYHFRDALGLSNGNPLLNVLAQGYLAVDFFFVLSGFVIFLAYEHDFAKFTMRTWAIFMTRRFARIYPLHLIILCAFLLNPLAIHYFSKSGVIDGRYNVIYFVASLVLVQNWGFFDELAWNIPAWSISTEFAAYLAFPVVLLLVRRLCRGIVTHFVACALAAVLLALIFKYSQCMTMNDKITHLGLVRCLLEFSIGVVAGNLFKRHALFTQSTGRQFAASIIAVWALSWAMDLPDFVYVPTVFGLAVLVFANTAVQKMPVLTSSTMVFLGEISYSTYLVHFLVKDWIKFFSHSVDWISFTYYIFFVFAVSVLLYFYIEKPGRTWGNRLIFRKYPDSIV